MKYDSEGRLLPHRYREIRSWFGKRCETCSYAADAPIHDVVERDREFERAFLEMVEDYAKHLGGPDDTAFVRMVNYRVDGKGSERYGDNSFLTDGRDLLAEAREEFADGVAYPMFYAERYGLTPDDESFIHLTTAAAHAAVADYHVRLAQQLQRMA